MGSWGVGKRFFSEIDRGGPCWTAGGPGGGTSEEVRGGSVDRLGPTHRPLLRHLPPGIVGSFGSASDVAFGEGFDEGHLDGD